MKRFYFTAATFAIILVIFAAFSCKTTKSTTKKEGTTKSNKDSIIIKPIVLDTENAYAESDPFELLGATLNGSILEIEVQYGGGCGGDTWTLAWNGMLMKSLPPKANIWLHLKDEDNCRAEIRKKLLFDISSIYSKEVVLLLKDYKEELIYKP